MLVSHFMRKPRSARTFHTSSSERASVLFALGALSNSRETQHFNKLSHLSRVEHSPPLKLIKSSEVDPFPLPTPPKASPLKAPGIRARSAAKIWDDKAIKVGRAILSDNARQMSRMSRALERAKKRQSKADKIMQRSLADWGKERQKLHSEMRQAGVWILAAVGTATGLAMWRFWPQNEMVRDSGDLGRKIAARAKEAMPLPAASSAVGSGQGPAMAAPSQTVALPVLSSSKPSVAFSTSPEAAAPSGSWWRSLLWKQP